MVKFSGSSTLRLAVSMSEAVALTIMRSEQKRPINKFLLLCEKMPAMMKLRSGKNSEIQNKIIS